MRRFLLATALATGLCAAAAPKAEAAFLNAPLPANAYITKDGLDWAWAFPLPASGGLDLSYQAGQGWRLPTAAELALAPLATDFLFSGANVPLGGTDPISGASFAATNGNLTGAGACATPYFSNSYRHCDWQDGNGQPWGPWAEPGAWSLADQLVVRASAVSAPATLGLLGAGLIGLGAVTRRRRQAA